MKRKLSSVNYVFVLFVCIGLMMSFATQAIAENTPVKKANYKLAERFSPTKLGKMTFSTSVSPHWLKLSERFWYVYETSEGKTFFIVDPTRKTKKSIFDNVKMAALLSNMTKDPYDAKHLPIDTIKFSDDEKTIYFKVTKNEDVLAAEKKQAEWDKKDEEKDVEKKDEEKEVEKKEVKDEVKKEKEKSEIEKAKEEAQKFHHFEYDLASGKLTLLEGYVDEPNRASWANISPDGETILFGKHYNIFSMSKADYEKWLNNPDDETIEEVQLTTDGEENFAYHGGGRGENNVTKEKEKDDRKSVRVYWSHDSKKFASIRTDSRKVKDLWVINSVSEPRPTLETYKYQMPGEAEAPQEEMFVFDLESKEKKLIKAEAFKDQTLSIFGHSYPINTRDDRNRATMWISESS
ncbi:MAG: DPP IV N-terminal domain-containing protein, partial [Candidatus Aminicenantes bacterium]|nr:DPP IV N-terminal domain-containing protein [Candidatus Aminicenantes bacterium]